MYRTPVAKGKGPALNQAPRYENVWVEWRYDSSFLNLQLWIVTVSFTPQSLSLLGESPDTHGVGDWVGPTAGLGAMTAKKIYAPVGYGTPIHRSSSL
jgi:hypothetical protein